MKLKTLIAWTALAWGLASTAYAQAPVLKGSDVNENALVDALTIEGPTVTDGQMRGFKPTTTPGGKAQTRKVGPGKASLLITFSTDSAELTPDARATLDTLARAVQSDALAGFSFNVEGHADSRGDFNHNMELSKMRAESVVSYLISQHGILPERLTAIGKGSTEQLNAAQPDAPENRRVTIVTVRG